LGRLIRTSSTASTTSAFISLTTALYLFPLIPNLFGIIDQNIRDSEQNEETESKANLLTFMAFCAMRFATRFAITSRRSSYRYGYDEEQAIGGPSGLVSADAQARERCSRLSKIDAGKLEDRDFDLHRLLLENLEASDSAEAWRQGEAGL
jgi:hypothetical protein